MTTFTNSFAEVQATLKIEAAKASKAKALPLALVVGDIAYFAEVDGELFPVDAHHVPDMGHKHLKAQKAITGPLGAVCLITKAGAKALRGAVYSITGEDLFPSREERDAKAAKADAIDTSLERLARREAEKRLAKLF